jgi:hypothetical protein
LTEDRRLSADPNNPTEASIDNLYNAMQVNVGGQLTGELARVVSIWMQQMSGTERQYLPYNTYSLDTDTFIFLPIYSQGGLVDIRRVQDRATDAGDLKYRGVAKVWEALLMGTAADLWGDIPYRNALDASLPQTADPQLQVYDDLIALLDEAITDLACAEAACRGPGALDRVYGNDAALWTEAANTLKARLYLHKAEVEPAAYAQALAAAQAGISSSDNDFRANYEATPRETNLWYQFMVEQRAGYIAAGAGIVDLMNARNDPRRAEYFSDVGGQFVGATPAATSPTGISSLSDTRLDPGFDQPILTWAENQLIIAEAALATSQPGVAQTALDAVRTEAGLPSTPATLQSVMEEKYIALFQNVEVWSDWRRTCIPNIAPAAGRKIPHRLFYPASETNVNAELADPATGRNANDPGDPAGCQG